MKEFKYILFSFDGACASMAKKLQDEGREVYYTQIQEAKSMPEGSWMSEPEDPERKKRRLSIYDGIIEKHKDKEILKWMETIENKDDYFVFFDFNSFYEISEKVLEMGFTNGYFPLEDDYLIEQDRQSGKDFAKKYIKGIKVADVHAFNKIDEGIEFLNDNPDKIYALKSDGNNTNTIVPLTNNPEFAKNELIRTLKHEQKDYEKGGFSLEEKIQDITEVCPQICFYNGKPIYTEIEMETRLLGAGDIGYQTGGNQNVIMQTNFSDKINKMCFPKIIYDDAKKRTGIYLKDCGLLIDKKGVPYFSEFAGNRYSWGGMFSELTMAGGVSDYFETLASGKNPYKNKVGCTISFYNLDFDPDTGLTKDNIPFQWEDDIDKRFFPYTVKIDDEDDEEITVNIGTKDIIAAYFSGAGNNLVQAVNRAYEFTNKMAFNGVFYRPKFDLMSNEYISSIPNRIKFLRSKGFIS